LNRQSPKRNAALRVAGEKKREKRKKKKKEREKKEEEKKRENPGLVVRGSA